MLKQKTVDNMKNFNDKTAYYLLILTVPVLVPSTTFYSPTFAHFIIRSLSDALRHITSSFQVQLMTVIIQCSTLLAPSHATNDVLTQAAPTILIQPFVESTSCEFTLMLYGSFDPVACNFFYNITSTPLRDATLLTHNKVLTFEVGTQL